MTIKRASVLTDDKLNATDDRVLDLVSKGRVTPQYVAEQLDVSRTYASERLKRFVEHGHIDRVAPGLYELVDDPRSGDVDLPADLHQIGFVEEFKIFDDAEDVKTVRFIGTRGTADIQITDQTMVEFAAIAKEVFTRIHGDIDLLRELLDEYDG